MKFKVIGSSRETGARMTLEFEAESKAAAERKATQSGMSVNRVEDITDGYPAHATEPRARRPQRRRWGEAQIPRATGPDRRCCVVFLAPYPTDHSPVGGGGSRVSNKP